MDETLAALEAHNLTFAYFAALSLMVGWSLPDGVAADRPVATAKRLPDTSVSAALPPTAAAPLAEASRARSKVNCVGCGVIESVHRIDTPIPMLGECHFGEGAGIPGRFIDVGRLYAPDSLASTVASVIADARGRTKVAVDTRHRIVVRFRDGSKQVFDEITPRSLRVGDRIVVIAGTAATPAKPLIATEAPASGEFWRSVRLRTDG